MKSEMGKEKGKPLGLSYIVNPLLLTVCDNTKNTCGIKG